MALSLAKKEEVNGSGKEMFLLGTTVTLVFHDIAISFFVTNEKNSKNGKSRGKFLLVRNFIYFIIHKPNCFLKEPALAEKQVLFPYHFYFPFSTFPLS